MGKLAVMVLLDVMDALARCSEGCWALWWQQMGWVAYSQVGIAYSQLY
jgi:hypothetical protein